MTNGLHMGPNLMRAPGLQTAFNQCHVPQAFKHGVVRYRPLALIRIIIHRHDLAVPDTAADISGDRTVFRNISPYKGDVLTRDGMIEKLLGEVSHSPFVFANHE